MPQTWFSKNTMWSQKKFFPYADFNFSSSSSPFYHIPSDISIPYSVSENILKINRNPRKPREYRLLLPHPLLFLLPSTISEDHPRTPSRKYTGFLSPATPTLPENKREEIPENTVFQGFLRGQGRKGKDLKEKRKEDGKMAKYRCLVGLRGRKDEGKEVRGRKTGDNEKWRETAICGCYKGVGRRTENTAFMRKTAKIERMSGCGRRKMAEDRYL